MNSSFDLTGKVFVVIGGSGLIGKAFCEGLAQAGGIVVNADKKSGDENVDIANPKSVESLAKRVAKKFGHIDGVVNVAYPRTKNYPQAFGEASHKETLENISLMLGGNFSVVRAFAPLMKKQKKGSIVFLGSIYGVAAPKFEIYKGTSMANPPEYAAAKGGTIMLGKYFASLLGPSNIRVNTISPGGVFNNQPKSFLKAYNKHAKIKPGMLLPEDLAGALIFLFSDASKKVTGQNIVVDGGWTI